MRARLVTLGLIALALVAVGCSFTLATGFQECTSDQDCDAKCTGEACACSRHYCLPLPEGCSRREGAFDQADRIPLAALVPISGDVREAVRLESVQLAIAEANGGGGIANRRFGLFVCEVADTEDASVSRAEWLIRNLEVPAILTSGSSQTGWVAKDAVRIDAGTFIMSANSTSFSLIRMHQTHGNVWRVAPPDTKQAQVLRGLITDAGVTSTVSIFFDAKEYGEGLKYVLTEELAQAGLSLDAKGIVGYQSSLDAQKADALIANARDHYGAATVLIGFPADVGQLAAAAAKEPGLSPDAGHLWFLSDAARDEAIANQRILDGAVGTAPALARGVAFANFSATFQRRFTTDPEKYSYTAHSYDSIWLTLAAMAWASQEGGAIDGRRMGEVMGHLGRGSESGPEIKLLGANWSDLSLALSSGHEVNVEGSSGPLEFDVTTGAPSSDYEIWRVADGGISSVTFVTP
jgi:branched-chain amino acid transport system substrate-binding protein